MAWTPTLILPKKNNGWQPLIPTQEDSFVGQLQQNLSGLGSMRGSTPQTTTASTLDVLQVPDYATGALSSIPARVTALALGVKQPRIETFTEQALEATKGVGPKLGPALGFGAALIGDPLNLLGGGATKIFKTIEGLKDLNKAKEFAKTVGVAEDFLDTAAEAFVKANNPTDAKKAWDSIVKLQSTAKKNSGPFVKAQGENLTSLSKTRDDLLIIDTGRTIKGQPIKSVNTDVLLAEDITGYKELDSAQVQKYVDDIEARKPLDPLIVQVKDGNIYVEDGKNRLAALRKKGIENVDVIEKSLERSFVASVKKAVPQLSTRVAGQYIPRATDTLATQAANLIKDDLETALNLARTGDSDKAIATAAELIKHYTNEALAATKASIKNTLFDKAAEIANTTARTLTEQGRAVQAASIMGRLTPEGVVRFAAREIQKYNETIDVAKTKLGGMNPTAMKKKIPELTGEQVADFTKKAKSIQEMPDGVEKAMAWHKLNDQIASLIPAGLYAKLISVWKAGLLTGIKTSGLNISSNLFHGVSEIVKDVPAATVDSIASLFTGERTLALTAKGVGSGLVEGLKKGWRYLKTGFDERDVAGKLDLKRVNFGTSRMAKAIQAYEETIFKIIGAEDQPFYYGAKARSLYSQAIAKAKNKSLLGTARKDFVDNLVQNPTDEMLKYAVYDAETAVFQNKTALGTAAKALQRIPGGELAVPFSKTPSSVAMQVINYSPLGIIKTLADNIGKGRFDQRLFSQNLARNLIGTGVMYLGYKMFESNIVSLGRPTTEKEIEQWKLEGRSANSILIDDNWRSANVLGPAGLTLILGGYLAQGIKETGSLTQGIFQMAAGLPKTLTDQTFLRGLDDFISAIKDPAGQGKNYFSGLIGSIVPTIVGDVARSADSVERRTPGFFDRIKSRIPGLRGKLQPQVDVLGQENKIDTNIIETMADPTRPSTVSNDPVVLELRRLTEEGFQSTPTLLGDKQGFPKALTPEQNTQLWKRVGELLKGKLDNLIQTTQYKQMDDEQKQKIIQQFTDKAKVNARAEMVVSLTLGLSGAELKEKLSELKSGGLLTKEVLNKYAEIR